MEIDYLEIDFRDKGKDEQDCIVGDKHGSKQRDRPRQIKKLSHSDFLKEKGMHLRQLGVKPRRKLKVRWLNWGDDWKKKEEEEEEEEWVNGNWWYRIWWVLNHNHRSLLP